MSDFPTVAFLHELPWAAISMVAVLGATFVVSRIARKHSVIDAAWGLLFVAVATSAILCSASYGDGARRIMLIVLPTVWGLRLAGHIGRRTIGKPEDPRYVALLAKAKGNPNLYALRMVYFLQGALAFLISAPIQVGVFEAGPVGIIAWIGVALWLIGMFFESTGDHQMERFRRDPANKGKVIDVGLWRYTRHPNYFGDACVWWGIFLVAADSWPGILTVLAPIAMTVLLTQGSGVRILDKHMSDRPGWSEYAASTSAFFPMPRKLRR